MARRVAAPRAGVVRPMRSSMALRSTPKELDAAMEEAMKAANECKEVRMQKQLLGRHGVQMRGRWRCRRLCVAVVVPPPRSNAPSSTNTFFPTWRAASCGHDVCL